MEKLKLPDNWTYQIGDKVQKKVRNKNSASWHGIIVGGYQTECNSEGYAIESAYERCSVQVYPLKMLEKWDGNL